MRPIFYIEKISDLRFVIIPFIGKDSYLQCDIYNRHTDEYVDTVKANTLSEIQDIIARKCR